MSLGHKITQLRLKAEMTQRKASELTGLATSYLSRLENGHINPSIGTLSKISKAFGVPLYSFFASESGLEQRDRCPISPSGQCILDLPFCSTTDCRGQSPKKAAECYTSQQLKTLSICNLLLQTDKPKIVKSLLTVIESLLALSATSDDAWLETIMSSTRTAQFRCLPCGHEYLDSSSPQEVQEPSCPKCGSNSVRQLRRS